MTHQGHCAEGEGQPGARHRLPEATGLTGKPFPPFRGCVRKCDAHAELQAHRQGHALRTQQPWGSLESWLIGGREPALRPASGPPCDAPVVRSLASVCAERSSQKSENHPGSAAGQKRPMIALPHQVQLWPRSSADPSMLWGISTNLMTWFGCQRDHIQSHLNRSRRAGPSSFLDGII